MRLPTAAFVLLLLAPASACAPAEGATDAWNGSMDTLPSGQILVHSTADPAWSLGREWRVTEERRIGTIEGDGPDLFGRITSLEVDPLGRIWVLEGQAQEIRVFDPDGRHVRTIGRSGGGPGEFAQAVHLQMGPDGHMWVVDPQNNRVSRFDTAGVYLEGRQSPGGFIILPWPGGFDTAGYYYSPVPLPSDEIFSIGLVRYDPDFVPLDTVAAPTDPETREQFELRSGTSRMMTSVPFSAGFDWRLAPSGTIWGLLTGPYRLHQFSLDGDTLRTVTRAFDPMPVTEADMEEARERLDWFTRQGGQIDLGKVPSHKPAAEDLFFDDEGNVWVQRVGPRDRDDRVVDVFDPEGRYLGEIELPFRLTSPYPVIRGTTMIAVTQDELEVPYIVVARIEKP